jgi:hypothetical protein
MILVQSQLKEPFRKRREFCEPHIGEIQLSITMAHACGDAIFLFPPRWALV